jgi:HTH-type transcriptional regulator / antitoxin HigA
MEIKPIRNEADYQAALIKIDKLMVSQPGTTEGDRMDGLVTLVEAYEATHFPIPEPDDSVEVLKYYMESRGLSRADLMVGKQVRKTVHKNTEQHNVAKMLRVAERR